MNYLISASKNKGYRKIGLKILERITDCYKEYENNIDTNIKPSNSSGIILVCGFRENIQLKAINLKKQNLNNYKIIVLGPVSDDQRNELNKQLIKNINLVVDWEDMVDKENINIPVLSLKLPPFSFDETDNLEHHILDNYEKNILIHIGTRDSKKPKNITSIENDDITKAVEKLQNILINKNIYLSYNKRSLEKKTKEGISIIKLFINSLEAKNINFMKITKFIDYKKALIKSKTIITFEDTQVPYDAFSIKQIMKVKKYIYNICFNKHLNSDNITLTYINRLIKTGHIKKNLHDEREPVINIENPINKVIKKILAL